MQESLSIEQEYLSLPPEERDDLLWEIQKKDYTERPVDIETFCTDSEFLREAFWGKWDDLAGFNPWWTEHLKKLHPSPFYSPFKECVGLLPVGGGKTTTALCSIAYDIYKLNCLKDPQGHYNIRPKTTPIRFMLFSAARELADDINWTILESLITNITRPDHTPECTTIRTSILYHWASP